MTNSSASILARLKNKAKSEGIAFQQLLNLLFQEEFIRRLSKSSHKKKLILKGGYLLYSISGFTSRPTIDGDYLLKNHSSDIESIRNLTNAIIKNKSPDTVMDIDILDIEPISSDREYSGVRVKLMGYLGKTRTPFHIDFGVGDIIIPSPLKRKLPTLLEDFEEPIILTYSLESTISEKLDAIIRFMESTGRMKDFYDIYYIASTFKFSGVNIQDAIKRTFTTRSTSYEKDSILVIKRLTKSKAMITRWDNFCKKVLKYELSFLKVVSFIITFLDPPFQAIITNQNFQKTWNPTLKQYF